MRAGKIISELNAWKCKRNAGPSQVRRQRDKETRREGERERGRKGVNGSKGSGAKVTKPGGANWYFV
jgi:hypothetical protein